MITDFFTWNFFLSSFQEQKPVAVYLLSDLLYSKFITVKVDLMTSVTTTWYLKISLQFPAEVMTLLSTDELLLSLLCPCSCVVVQSPQWAVHPTAMQSYTIVVMFPSLDLMLQTVVVTISVLFYRFPFFRLFIDCVWAALLCNIFIAILWKCLIWLYGAVCCQFC